MRIRNIFIGVMASVAAFIACEEQQTNLGIPEIKLSTDEMAFDAEGGELPLTLTATRDWQVEADADWVVVSPESGPASANEQTVTVTVLENTGLDRSADLKFTIGMKSRYLTVTQAGPGGSAEALIVYENDFDKEKAVKDGNYWPYPDQTECWMNQTGTGSAAVGFGAKNITVRDNSNSDSYADASGTNNIFFGKAPNYFTVSDIALPDSKDFTLSFGTIRNEYNAADNTFKNSEFHVWLSADGKKWVEISYEFADGPKSATWDRAFSTFSLSAPASKLYITFTSDVASSHRLDDLKLEVSSEAGAIVDFSTGTDKDFEASGSVTPPSNIVDVTVAEFNQKEVSSTDWYRLTGVVGGSINTQYGNYDLTDATGTVYVYGTSNWSDYSSKFAAGATVTIVGQRGDYNGKIEVLESYIESYTAGQGGNTGGDTEKYYIYKKAESVASGKSYIIVAGTKAATPISGNYGYIQTADVNVSGDEIVASAVNAFTFTSVDGGYTIRQSDDRYLYMTGDYNSFNLDAFPSSGHVWTVSFNDGAAVITNNEKSKSIQFDSQYGSYGSYPDVRGTYPVLYEQTAETEAPETGGGSDDNVNPNATVITLDASSKPCDSFPEGSTGVTETRSYTIGGYDWTFSPSSGNKFSWYTDGYVLWGKKGAYVLLPSVEGKALTRITILTGKNASTSVQVGVYDENGSAAVSGGAAITLNAKDKEFTYNLTGTASGARYQLRVVNDKNAQFQKLTLIYE